MADKEYIERETAIKAAEMACDMCTVKHICNSPGEPIDSCYSFRCAKIAVQKGYRKQSEGEWIFKEYGEDTYTNLTRIYECSLCGRTIECLNEADEPYCHCGAKMKGV